MNLKLSALALFLIFGLIAGNAINFWSAAAVYKQLTAIKADSLIKANAANPDFVILDVRTPGEYTPNHIEGAINRNYNDPNFNTMLSQLNKQKIYLIHCQSGGRSAGAFAAMKTLQFNEVYEMIGGMNSWTGASLPTTSKFAPKLMIDTKGIDTLRSVKIGNNDTVKVRITNRANDTLKITGVTNFINPEFSTNINSAVKLAGSEDYTFNIIFKPADLLDHSVKFSISTNGGSQEFTLNRKGVAATGIVNVEIPEIILYPNPATDKIFLKNLPQDKQVSYTISGINGQQLGKAVFSDHPYIEVSNLKTGIYHLRIDLGESIISRKIIIGNQGLPIQ